MPVATPRSYIALARGIARSDIRQSICSARSSAPTSALGAVLDGREVVDRLVDLRGVDAYAREQLQPVRQLKLLHCGERAHPSPFRVRFARPAGPSDSRSISSMPYRS